jgi:hypothetical protein
VINKSTSNSTSNTILKGMKFREFSMALRAGALEGVHYFLVLDIKER